MTAKKYGFDRAHRMVSQLDKDIERASLLALKRVGIMAEREILMYIKSQPSVWPKLSEDYLKFKARKGLSTSTLIATSDMFNRITSHDFGSTILVGISKKATNSEGENIADIAATMEYGSLRRNIPPRPFLLPSKAKIIKHLQQTGYFGKFVLNYIKKKNGLL